jgi:hypothetical protein
MKMGQKSIKTSPFSFFRKHLMLIQTTLLISIFLFAAFFPAGNFPKKIYAQEANLQPEMPYDFVLVIDESGSMRNNDPRNMRKDAAKLFFYLAEAFNKGSRILVSGFGSSTNIYLEMSNIAGNEKIISTAIDKIASNQGLTDMKLALETIKKNLDQRKQQRKTMVIFLTDGALTLSDIPPEGSSGDNKDREQEKPEGPDDGRGPIDTENPVDTGRKSYGNGSDSIGGTRKGGSDSSNNPAQKESYLESYKKEMLDLCYDYKQSGIIINPIAFTNKAEVEILQQMANITGGVCYKPQKDTDLRTSFFEILKDLSDRFIKTEEQKQPDSISGNLEITEDIKSLYIVSFKNQFNSVPSISLINPDGEKSGYSNYVNENIFKIVKLSEMSAGKWSYKIGGDAIFIYDIADFVLQQPAYAAYLTNTKIPLKIDVKTNTEAKSQNSDNDGSDTRDSNNGSGNQGSGVFNVSAEIENPAGSLSKIGPDDFINSGMNYEADYQGALEQGYYDITYSIEHVPTGSVASKRVSFEAVRLPVALALIEPSLTSYKLGQDIKVVVKMEKDKLADKDVDLSDYILTFNVMQSQGPVVKDIILLDNGTGPDSKAGDGLYSGTYKNTLFKDSYKINIFISRNTVNSPQIFSGISASFSLTEGETAITDKEDNSVSSDDGKVTETVKNSGSANDRQDEESLVIMTKSRIITLIAAGSGIFILLIAGIVLLLYFLFFKPRKLKKKL